MYKHVFSGYHKYQKAWDAPILSCERGVGNIHDTFAVAIAKDGEESHCCGLSLFLQLSFQFQTSELVINTPTKSITSLAWPDQFMHQQVIDVQNINKRLACKLVWPHETRSSPD